MQKIKWGIIGCGNIAHKFAKALSRTDGCIPFAAAARDKNRAAAFAARWGFIKSYGSYREIVEDNEVDVIYIATPHSYHYGHAKLCLEAGKHVLCEKPFTVHNDQLKVLTKLAREKKLFLMEALWSRFLPGIIKASELVKEGAIGDIVYLEADFGLRFPYDPVHRLYNPLMAGGALLDLGIYPLYLSLFLLGKPEVIKAHSLLNHNMIDLTTSIITQSSSGTLCNLNATVLANTPVHAKIVGTEGKIEFDSWWFSPVDFKLSIHGRTEEKLSFPALVNGYEYEISETVKCLREGKIESRIMPHSFSHLLMETMDEIRRITGICYPKEIEQIDIPYGWDEL